MMFDRAEQARRINALGYDVTQYAHRHRISREAAAELLRHFEPDRERLDAVARALKAGLAAIDDLAQR